MGSVYTVTQVNGYIKNMFTQDFVLNRISVSGEISNLKYHTSGHIYFTLKDSGGTLSAVMFASARSTGLDFKMENGQQIVVSGSVNIYERDGKYQIYAKKIEKQGKGELYIKYEKLKKELEEMGMFAPEYKKPVKRFNKTIGVVTAKTGAAIQDIINISGRRNPYAQLYLYPAIVQGESAAASIVKGIEKLDSMNLDVIIVGRGGGSFEDLFAFNEEIVARAIFNCNTPVISAVGHETDFTIADFVADMRAPTPSAAAELAVYDVSILESSIEGFRYELNRIMSDKVYRLRNELKQYIIRLGYLSPSNMLNEKRAHVLDMQEKLNQAMTAKINVLRQQVMIMGTKLHGLSPLIKMSEGYAVIENNKGDVISGIDMVNKNDELNIHLIDGMAKVTVNETKKVQRGK